MQLEDRTPQRRAELTPVPDMPINSTRFSYLRDRLWSLFDVYPDGHR